MPIRFYKPYFSPDSRRQIVAGIDRMLESGQLMLGEYATKLEAAFAAEHGVPLAVSTNSCTSALQICLTHFDVRGREVLVPAAGFITDVSAVRWAGGIPVLVDIDPATLSFDLEDLRRKITPRTRGMIWVHLIGVISPAWQQILAIAKEKGLFVIEDCAHAHGASVNGQKAGSMGDVGVFSFYPTKVMTSGTGGILVTRDAALAKSAREIRLFGRENGNGEVVREGNDWFLDEIRACVAYHQLMDLKTFLERRREIAAIYQEKLKDVPGITLLDIPAGNQPSWYHYTVILDRAMSYQQVVKELKEKHGVPTKPIYIPLHQEIVFRDLDTGSLKRTENVLNHSLCLPLYVEMPEAEVLQVVEAVTEVVANQRCEAGS